MNHHPTNEAIMKSHKPVIALLTALAFSVPAHAQPSSTAPATTASAVAPTEFTNAEVRKVDKAGRKVTLKHEEIRNLGMPPMAMVFEVKDAALLDRVKAGDKVRFKAIWQGGKYFLTEIQPAG
jgi:Cu/Ag efflux protein CusF